ncbi:unnamed protein product, partial [Symbiodinium sp. CCMP2456]
MPPKKSARGGGSDKASAPMVLQPGRQEFIQGLEKVLEHITAAVNQVAPVATYRKYSRHLKTNAVAALAGHVVAEDRTFRAAQRDLVQQIHTDFDKVGRLTCTLLSCVASSMSTVSTIGVTAFSLAGRELAKVDVPRDVSVRMLVEALGATAGISWDALQLTWKGETFEDWSLQPFAFDSELSSIELQVVLQPQPAWLETEQAVELLQVLKEPYDGLRSLSFALGSLRELSLGAKDDDPCLKDSRGDESSGVMSASQLNALSRAVLDRRLQCTVLCLRGVLRPMALMDRVVDRQDSANLVSLLSHMPQLTSLDLSGNRLGYTNTCMGALSTAMPKLQKLTYLNLSCNGFFSFHGLHRGSGALPPHSSELFVSLLTLPALEVLDLHLNDKALVRGFDAEKEELASWYLPRLLKELPSLKKLVFAAIDAGLSTVAALEAARQPGCQIDYGLGDHVAKALCSIQEPREEGVFRLPLLDLEPAKRSWPVRAAYYWHMGCGLSALEEDLRRRVVSVDVSGTELGRSWPALVEHVLPHFPALCELKLQETQVAVEFLMALHQPAFASLTKIDLAGCGLCHFTNLGEDGPPQIAQAFLFWSESLTDLDLSQNFISEYGDFSPGHLEHNLPPLVRGLKRLKRLALRDNDIGVRSKKRFWSLIRAAFDFEAGSLEELDLECNNLESPEWAELVDRLRAVAQQLCESHFAQLYDIYLHQQKWDPDAIEKSHQTHAQLAEGMAELQTFDKYLDKMKTTHASGFLHIEAHSLKASLVPHVESGLQFLKVQLRALASKTCKLAVERFTE